MKLLVIMGIAVMSVLGFAGVVAQISPSSASISPQISRIVLPNESDFVIGIQVLEYRVSLDSVPDGLSGFSAMVIVDDFVLLEFLPSQFEIETIDLNRISAVDLGVVVARGTLDATLFNFRLHAVTPGSGPLTVEFITLDDADGGPIDAESLEAFVEVVGMP